MRKLINVCYVVALATVLTNLSGCDPDEDKPKFDKSNLHGNWKLTALTAKAGGVEEDAFKDLEACTTDDIFAYNSDGTHVHTEGQTKCESTDPDQVDAGTWSISNDRFLYTNDDGTTTSKILTLTATSFSIQIDIEFLGTNVTLTSTYTKQ
jgi:hypothetical protein